MLVMNEEVRSADAIPEGHNLRRQAFEADAAVLVLAKDHGLAMLQHQLGIDLGLFISQRSKRAVVIDVTVLQDLNKRCALVLGSTLDDVLLMLGLDIDSARDKGRIRTERQE